MVFSPAITPFAFAVLLFISFVQSLFHVSRLPKYTNSFTFSITSSCTLISISVVSSNTIAFVLSTFVYLHLYVCIDICMYGINFLWYVCLYVCVVYKLYSYM